MGIVWKGKPEIRWYLTHPIKWIEDTCKDLKWAWQRATKGYSDYDRYDMDFWFLKTIVPMLREFKDKTNSYPSGMSIEEWQEIIERMAQCFEEADRESDDMNGDMNKALERLHEGMEMFERYFFHLWD